MSDIRYYEEPPSYQHFLKEHLMKNVPALIGPSLTSNWNARKEWVESVDQHEPDLRLDSPAPTTQPNYEFLNNAFGTAQVQVADCLERDFTDQKRGKMTFADFIGYWKSTESDSASRYYLKDWHFTKAFPSYHAYDVPYLFEDDWMNEYWPTRKTEDADDYRFVYMGGDKTFTPFHADVYRSYSWSSNICGVKRWTLFPPGQEHLFKDRFGNTVYDIRDVDESKFPRFAEAKRIVIFQVDGTTLFVPSGWWHQVENIGATISINHNWGNACNLHIMNESLENDLADVRHTISDVKEMMDSLEYEQTCQHILLVNSGWNWETLWGMLTCIAERLLQELKGSNLVTYQPPISYSLQVIRQVTEKWRTCKEKRRVFEAAENQDIETLNRVLEIAQEQLESSSRDTLN